MLKKKDNSMKWNDFLNPRSMITPGVAGSVVMVITNTLWVEFMLPQKWTALLLSFILILPILIKFSASMIESSIYFVFNGLIVFALAVNTNYAGRTLQNFATKEQPVISQQNVSPLFELKTKLAMHDEQNKLKLLREKIMLADNSDQDDKNLTQKEKNEREEKLKNEKSKDKDNRKFFGTWL